MFTNVQLHTSRLGPSSRVEIFHETNENPGIVKEEYIAVGSTRHDCTRQKAADNIAAVLRREPFDWGFFHSTLMRATVKVASSSTSTLTAKASAAKGV